MGKFAIYVFWLIALAGILQRFRVKGFLKKVQNVLLPNRRQLGILMFVLSFTHYSWSKGFSIISNGIPSSLPLFQIFGFSFVISAPNYLKQLFRKKTWENVESTSQVGLSNNVFVGFTHRYAGQRFSDFGIEFWN